MNAERPLVRGHVPDNGCIFSEESSRKGAKAQRPELMCSSINCPCLFFASLRLCVSLFSIPADHAPQSAQHRSLLLAAAGRDADAFREPRERQALQPHAARPRKRREEQSFAAED